jgi:hypothetical protein
METPAAFAAGRRWSEQNTDEQIGTLPRLFIDGNTKPVGLVWRMFVPFAQIVG